MRVTLPVGKVKPCMIRKLNEIELSIKDKERELEDILVKHEEALMKYRYTPTLFKLFKSKPEHPKDGLLSVYGFIDHMKDTEERKYFKLQKVLSTLDYTDTVTLTDDEISYYNIRLS